MNDKIMKEFRKYAAFLSQAQNLNKIEQIVEEVLSGKEPAASVPATPSKKPPQEEEHKHRITSPFGVRTHPVSGKRKMHSGIDLGADRGDPIYAFESGTVIAAGWRYAEDAKKHKEGKPTKDPSGMRIIIDHGDSLKSSYSHLSVSDVSVGDKVERGEIIGKVGTTGRVTGPHVHFRLSYKGKAINPEPFLAGRKIV